MVDSSIILSEVTGTAVQLAVSVETIRDLIAPVFGSTRVPLITVSIAAFAASIGLLNVIWKLRDEVYKDANYQRLADGLRDIDPELDPLKGFHELVTLNCSSGVSGLASAVLFAVSGQTANPFIILGCFLLAALTVFLAIFNVLKIRVSFRIAGELTKKKFEEEKGRREAERARPFERRSPGTPATRP